MMERAEAAEAIASTIACPIGEQHLGILIRTVRSAITAHFAEPEQKRAARGLLGLLDAATASTATRARADELALHALFEVRDKVHMYDACPVRLACMTVRLGLASAASDQLSAVCLFVLLLEAVAGPKALEPLVRALAGACGGVTIPRPAEPRQEHQAAE